MSVLGKTLGPTKPTETIVSLLGQDYPEHRGEIIIDDAPGRYDNDEGNDGNWLPMSTWTNIAVTSSDPTFSIWLEPGTWSLCNILSVKSGY